MGLNREQLAVIHIAKKELNLDDDLYRSILKSEAGVESSKSLSPQQFDQIMKRFKKLGFKKLTPKREKSGSALVLPSQMEFIEKLYDQLGWTERERRVGFNQRQITKPWPQSRSEANKIIEGLKAMIRRKKIKD